MAVLTVMTATVTERPFPVQLQANTAIAHLFKSGVLPENLQLIGDSAGGNLILQIFSHVLHDFPDPGFPSSPLRRIITGTMKPLRGAYLVSPWVNVSGYGGSFERNADKDALAPATYRRWGWEVLRSIPRAQLNFIEFHAAPTGWFDGISRLVTHILITVSDDECLHVDIIAFKDVFQE